MTSKVIGKDCDGKELCVGDRVKIIGGHPSVKPHRIDKEETVTREIEPDVALWLPILTEVKPSEAIMVTDADSTNGETVMVDWCTKLVNSGRDLFDQCKEQADSMPRESKVLESMPWTEPEP